MRQSARAEVVDFKPRLRGAAPLNGAVREALERYLHTLGDQPAHDLYAMLMEQVERPLLEVALERTGGNQCKAAVMLGLSRATLRKKMQRHGLL